jgi:hypothetical protein
MFTPIVGLLVAAQQSIRYINQTAGSRYNFFYDAHEDVQLVTAIIQGLSICWLITLLFTP